MMGLWFAPVVAAQPDSSAVIDNATPINAIFLFMSNLH
jgi:hypothetical protein